jgi:hypothetical protein
MQYISQQNLEHLLDGFREFFLNIFEALSEGRLEDALIIAEAAMAFMTMILDREENESCEDTNLFVFVENPQGCKH